MGDEGIYTTHHWVQCLECDSELDAKVEFHEYPRGLLQPTQIELIRNVEYIDPLGIDHLISDINSTIERRRNLRGEIEELHSLLDAQRSDLEGTAFFDFLSAVQELTSIIRDVVVVLGPHEHLQKMEEIVDELNANGYEAYIVRELPEFSDKSLESNVRIFTGLSRFCVVLDSHPLGHIKEYEMAKNQRSVITHLVPIDGGSTWMIGDEGKDFNYIEKFEYEDSPLEVIEPAISWAEEFLEEREEYHAEEYPWR